MSDFYAVTKQDLMSRGVLGTQWFIKNLLPNSGTTIFYGVPGEGKSTIGMECALAVQNGIPFAGFVDLAGDFVGEKLNTAWLSFEDDWEEEARGRLTMHDDELEWPLFISERQADGWGDAISLLLDGTNGDDLAGIFTADSQRRWDDFGKFLQGHGVRLLFVDTLSELAGTDAKAHKVQQIFRLLSRLRSAYGVATVLIGHSSSHKNSQGKRSSELLGATAWIAKARHTVLVDGNTKMTWAKVMKSNRGPTGFNVNMQKVDGGPITVISTNSQSDYVEQSAKSTQKRDWMAKRENAQAVRAAGPTFWVSADSIGKAAGGSKSIGKGLIDGGYFQSVKRGQYEPVDSIIDADWDSWNAEAS